MYKPGDDIGPRQDEAFEERDSAARGSRYYQLLLGHAAIGICL